MRFVSVVCALVVSAASAFGQDPVLNLEAPLGGITYYTTRDTSIQVRWSGVADTIPIQIEYTSDDGRNWVVIADSAKGLVYDWNIKGL